MVCEDVKEGISSCSRKAARKVARRKIGEAGDVAGVGEVVAQVFVAFQLFCRAGAVNTRQRQGIGWDAPGHGHIDIMYSMGPRRDRATSSATWSVWSQDHSISALRKTSAN